MPDAKTVLDAIGNTPLVALRRVVPKGAARVVVQHRRVRAVRVSRRPAQAHTTRDGKDA